jgi:hypothetical protein
MVPASRPPYLPLIGGTPSSGDTHKPPDKPGDSSMKALSIITLAIFLGLSGTAMANDSGEIQEGGNAVGPNPFMTFSDAGRTFSGSPPAGLSAVTVPSKLRSIWLAEDAFATHPVQHHVVKPHVKK